MPAHSESGSVSTCALTGALCGCMTALLGSLVMVGWALHWTALVRGSPALPPMQRNTAVCLVMCGVAIVGVVMGRFRMILIGSGVTATLGIASLLEYLLHSSFGIDELLGPEYISVHAPWPGRMAPATAVCLLLLAAAFALTRAQGRVLQSAMLGTSGLLVGAVGATCAVSTLAGRDTAFASGDPTRVAFTTAAGLFLLGLGAVAVAAGRIDFADGEPVWVPVGAGLFIAVFRIGLWQAFSSSDHIRGDFRAEVTLFGITASAILAGVFCHFFLKALIQRRALLAMNSRLQLEMVERRRAEEEAKAANRAKSQFLAHMSHEIRTPINGVLGMTELVLDTELSGDQRELLETARASAGALVEIVNDILDFSKIEAGRLDLNPVAFHLRDTVSRIVKLLACQAEKKGVEVLCDIRPEVPELVRADPTRFSQVITNLLGNAVKFTSAGEIELSISADKIANGDVSLHVSVRDTGIGIPAEKQATIFEPFTQADGSTTRRFGGTGLGLTVSRRLVEMMGGRIWVESQPGQGSCFHFTCQAAALQAKGMPDTAALVRLHGLSALVVDDNATNRRILAGMLESVGMMPVMAANGADALKMLARAATEKTPFGVTLLDGCMPEMDGFMLAEQIRTRRIAEAGAMVMLTSAMLRGDAGRCRELGIAVHLTKPVSVSQLVGAIRQALDETPAPELTPGPAALHRTHNAKEGLNILLAEDNAVNQKLAMRLLQQKGHRVTVVDTGRKALLALEAQAFDLILMDVQMPEMDGVEATMAIRDSEKRTLLHIPIVAMTAHAMNGDRERCLRSGMDGYTSKPIRPQELFAEIDRVRASVSGLCGTESPVQGSAA